MALNVGVSNAGASDAHKAQKRVESHPENDNIIVFYNDYARHSFGHLYQIKEVHGQTEHKHCI